MGGPQHGTYRQYKKKPVTLMRWLVTTASSCTAPISLKPTSDSPKQKEEAAQATHSANAQAFAAEISTAQLVILGIEEMLPKDRKWKKIGVVGRCKNCVR